MSQRLLVLGSEGALALVERLKAAFLGATARRFLRVTPAPNAPVLIQVMGEGFLESTRARDISVGGLALFIPHGIAADAFDARVKLIVTLPGQKAFVVYGIVRHMTQTADRRFVGVEFEALEGRALDSLTGYIDSRTTT